nr:hypothetical protein [Tanacetum cinerariifolium]
MDLANTLLIHDTMNATTVADVDNLKNDTTISDVDVLKNETTVANVELHPPSDDEDDAVIVISSDEKDDDVIIISSDDEDDNFIVISSDDEDDVASTPVQPQQLEVIHNNMDNTDMSMKEIVVVEPVIQTGVPKPGETKTDSEIVFAFEPMDVDVVVNPTVASVNEELYVALSRGTSRTTTKVLVKLEKEFGQEGVYTSNVVYQEVLRDD